MMDFFAETELSFSEALILRVEGIQVFGISDAELDLADYSLINCLP